MRIWSLIIGVCGLMLLTGCGKNAGGSLESFLREDVDLGFVQRIAVLPFENNTQNKYAPGRIRDIVTTQMLTHGLFDVVDKGLVDSVFMEEAIEKGAAIDSLTLKRLGQRLNVQAMLIGSVDIVDEVRFGAVTFPEVAITLRLLEAQSGMVLWQASGRESGESMKSRILGVSPKDTFLITNQLVSQMLETLPAGS